MGNIVEIKELFKTIAKEEILSGINLQISEGEIYGFLGPNGAGKTTLMKCMLSLSTVTSGSIEIFGKNLQDHREEILSQIGSVIETPIFYENCTAKEILEIHAQYMRKNITESDIIRALRMVGLKNTTKKVKEFSLGMRQRLGLARAFLTKPKLLILDEPINGLDPLGISEIRETLLQLQQENITILISSHILSELYLVANKFGILEGGKIVKELSKEQLDNECSHCLLLKVNDIKKASVLLEEELKTANYKVLNDQEIRLYDYLDAQHIVSKAIVEKGIELYAISEIGVSLEEYFKNIIRDGE